MNIEAPFERFELGFNTTDHFIDIVVRPDHSFFWKDREVMARWLDRGAYTADEVDRFYAAGKDLEPLIRSGRSPFDVEWTDWRPDSITRTPRIPDGWHTFPGVEMTLGLDRRWDAWKFD